MKIIVRAKRGGFLEVRDENGNPIEGLVTAFLEQCALGGTPVVALRIRAPELRLETEAKVVVEAPMPGPAAKAPGEGKTGEGKPGDSNPGDGKPGDSKPGDSNPGLGPVQKAEFMAQQEAKVFAQAVSRRDPGRGRDGTPAATPGSTSGSTPGSAPGATPGATPNARPEQPPTTPGKG